MDSIPPGRLLALVRPGNDLVLRRIRNLKRCVQACGCNITTLDMRFGKMLRSCLCLSPLKGNLGWVFGWLLAGFWLGWLLAGFGWLLAHFWLAFWLASGWLSGWFGWSKKRGFWLSKKRSGCPLAGCGDKLGGLRTSGDILIPSCFFHSLGSMVKHRLVWGSRCFRPSARS